MRYNDEIDETYEFYVSEEYVGNRLDSFIPGIYPDKSRSFIKKLIEDGLVLIDGQKSKPSRKLKVGETVTLNIPELIEMSAEPQDIPLEVLYEDEAIIVINKRPGIVVHPSPGHETGTIVNALLYHCDDLSGIGGELRPGIVHRLDRDTSGCMVCAKSDAAHQNLTNQFAERKTRKIYQTITCGIPSPLNGMVEGGIGRSPSNRQLMALLPAGGRYSLTYYKTLEQFNGFAFVECDIKTGRTHQIRLHMRSVGSPVLCDKDYGKQSAISRRELLGNLQAKKEDSEFTISRQALHAHHLCITHPLSNQPMEFTAPLPEDMQTTLQILRGNA